MFYSPNWSVHCLRSISQPCIVDEKPKGSWLEKYFSENRARQTLLHVLRPLYIGIERIGNKRIRTGPRQRWALRSADFFFLLAARNPRLVGFTTFNTITPSWASNAVGCATIIWVDRWICVTTTERKKWSLCVLRVLLTYITCRELWPGHNIRLRSSLSLSQRGWPVILMFVFGRNHSIKWN